MDRDELDLPSAEAWVGCHLTITGPLEHFQTEPWATVYRVPLGDDVAWFKSCAVTHAFEVPLTAGLSSRHPDVVTEVVAHDVDRRWLLMTDAGSPLRAFGNPPERWLHVLPRYAELQIEETAHVDDHLSSGVPDLRIAMLAEGFEELALARLPIEPSERSALARSSGRFAALCDELDGAGIEASVQHDDLHMYNVYAKDGRLRVLDWGDASVGHPFFSLFETFRFLVELNGLPSGDPWFARLRDSYLEPWGGDRRSTFELAERVGGAAHAIAWLRQREALPLEEHLSFDEGYAQILRIALAQLDGFTT